MEQRKLSYVPGLYKIFDEILVNAADNKQRDPSMSELRVEIDPEKNKISVFNNGRGIPVVMHKEHNVHVPELIFGAPPPSLSPPPLLSPPARHSSSHPSLPPLTYMPPLASDSLPTPAQRPPAHLEQL